MKTGATPPTHAEKIIPPAALMPGTPGKGSAFHEPAEPERRFGRPAGQ